MSGGQDDRAWNSSALAASIGRALLASNRPMTAAEIATVVSSHQSNVKKEVDQLARRGLVEVVEQPSEAPRRRGPRPETFALTWKQRDKASTDLPPRPANPGQLIGGQEVVVASADAHHVADLFDVLAGAEAAAKASWIALAGDEAVVAFDGPNAAEPAMELLAVLGAVRVPGRRATVTRVDSSDAWIGSARKALVEANRVSDRRDERTSG